MWPDSLRGFAADEGRASPFDTQHIKGRGSSGAVGDITGVKSRGRSSWGEMGGGISSRGRRDHHLEERRMGTLRRQECVEASNLGSGASNLGRFPIERRLRGIRRESAGTRRISRLRIKAGMSALFGSVWACQDGELCQTCGAQTST